MKDTSFLFLFTGLKTCPSHVPIVKTGALKTKDRPAGEAGAGVSQGLLRWSRCLAPQTPGEGGSRVRKSPASPANNAGRLCSREIQQQAGGSARKGRMGWGGVSVVARDSGGRVSRRGSPCQVVRSHP